MELGGGVCRSIPQVGGGAVGIVKIEQRSLRGQAGGAAVGRVGGITLQLGWAPLISLGHQRNGRPSQRQGGGKIEGQAILHLLHGLSEGEHVRLGPPAAGQPDAAKREGCRHELEELAPVDAVELRRALGKLALQVFAEAGRSGQFVQAPPVARAVQLA